MSRRPRPVDLLAFGAHPDDIEFGCGGVIARETQSGRSAHCVVCSKGESATRGTPRQRMAEARAAAAGHEYDGPENRGTAERCMFWAAEGPPLMPGGYNPNLQIFQGEHEVLIRHEMMGDARIIRTDGSGHIDSRIRQYHGDSIGHWEGATLVVDTIGVMPQTYIAISEAAGIPNNGDLHVTERIHLDPKNKDILLVDLEITAPKVLTKPWKTTRIFFRQRARIYDIIEGVCLEGYFKPGKDKWGNDIFEPIKHDVGGNRVPPK